MGTIVAVHDACLQLIFHPDSTQPNNLFNPNFAHNQLWHALPYAEVFSTTTDNLLVPCLCHSCTKNDQIGTSNGAFCDCCGLYFCAQCLRQTDTPMPPCDPHDTHFDVASIEDDFMHVSPSKPAVLCHKCADVSEDTTGKNLDTTPPPLSPMVICCNIK